jgi:uncharacterized membrane protein
MAVASKLNTYENQAKLSVLLGIVGFAALLSVIVMMRKNFDSATFYTTYNTESLWLPLFGGGLLVGLGVATVGFFIGLNSAGQRRNTQSSLAWKGFFLNAIVITCLLTAAIFFFFTRNSVTVGHETAAAPTTLVTVA